ncbi:MAG: carbon-nitrogen family hydrolase [Deltaproteobacteria bacterium]|nr:carbon-nitrogen family hydrolase [Deltaproteobacteria bacterium]
MTKIKIAGLQLDVEWENRSVNFERVRSFAKRAKDDGVDLLVLPEMFSTGFSLDPSVTAEAPAGETPRFVSELARELEIGIVGGYVQRRRDGRGANLAMAVDRQGRLLAEYAKTHLFSFMDEQQAHEAGAGPRQFAFEGVPIACFICYDLRFPELFRLVTDSAAVVIVIASWPAARQVHWDTLLPARAVENQLYVVGVNRAGQGGGLEYTGGSVIVDPMGKVLAHGGDQENLITAEIDPDEVARVRSELPFLADRRF